MKKNYVILLFVILSTLLEAKHFRLNTSLQYGDTAGLWIDAFLPPLVNEDTSVFFDFQQQYNGWTSGGHLAYLLSPGVGMRKKIGSQVFGAYLFADYFQSYHGKKFWGCGPGFDFYKGAFEVALNFYLPIGRQEKELSENQSTTITLKPITPTLHKALETTTITTRIKKERLPYGCDITGYYIPENKTYFAEGGFYYYNANHLKPITGGRVAIGCFPLPYLKLKLEEKYDNRSRNRIVGSIELSLGGVFNGNITSKLTYPIYRRQNLNTTKRGSTSELSSYRKKTTTSQIQVKNNTYYIRGGNPSTPGGGMGTFDDPYTSLKYALSSSSGAPSNANFLIYDPDNSANTTTVTLSGTHTLSGRTHLWQAPASILPPDEMLIITTQTINMIGDNKIQDFQLYQTGSSTTYSDIVDVKQNSKLSTNHPVLFVNGGSSSSSAEISNLVIKSKGVKKTNIVGIEVGLGASVNLTKSSIEVSSLETTHGILCKDGSIKVSDSIIKAHHEVGGGLASSSTGTTLATDINSDFTNVYILATSASTSPLDFTNGISASKTGTVNFEHGYISVSTKNATASGIVAQDYSQIMLSNSSLALASEAVQTAGLLLLDNSHTDVINSQITASAASPIIQAYCRGVRMLDSSTLNMTSNSNSIKSTGTGKVKVYGIYAENASSNNNLSLANLSIVAKGEEHTRGLYIGGDTVAQNLNHLAIHSYSTSLTDSTIGLYSSSKSQLITMNSSMINATGSGHTVGIYATTDANIHNLTDVTISASSTSPWEGAWGIFAESNGSSLVNPKVQNLVGCQITTEGGDSSYGIHYKNLAEHSTINNCSISAVNEKAFAYGIRIKDSIPNNHLIENTIINAVNNVDGKAYGAYLDDSHTTFKNTTLSANTGVNSCLCTYHFAYGAYLDNHSEGEFTSETVVLASVKQGASYGVWLDHNSKGTFTESFLDSQNEAMGWSFGAYLNNASQVKITNQTQLKSMTNTGFSLGVYVRDSSSGTFGDSTLTTTINDGTAFGLYATLSSSIFGQPNTIVDSSSVSGESYGAYLDTSSHGTFDGCSLFSKILGKISSDAYGVYLTSDAKINATNSVLDALTYNGRAYGGYFSDGVKGEFTKTSLSSKSTQGRAYGAFFRDHATGIFHSQSSLNAEITQGDAFGGHFGNHVTIIMNDTHLNANSAFGRSRAASLENHCFGTFDACKFAAYSGGSFAWGVFQNNSTSLFTNQNIITATNSSLNGDANGVISFDFILPTDTQTFVGSSKQQPGKITTHAINGSSIGLRNVWGMTVNIQNYEVTALSTGLGTTQAMQGSYIDWGGNTFYP